MKISDYLVVLTAITTTLFTGCASSQQQARHAVAPKATVVQSQPTASYTIDVTVVLSSELTQGGNRVMVELRKGAPGASKVVDTQYFEGLTGTVCFSNMHAGSYFIAIGNGDTVAVGPVRQFSGGQSVHTRVRVTQSSGNVGTQSRGSL